MLFKRGRDGARVAEARAGQVADDQIVAEYADVSAQ